MEQFGDYQEHIEQGVEWFWNFLPSLVTAILTLVVGLWVISFINKIVRRFFDKKDYDEALESFLQSFIKIALKLLLFVLVITQLGVKSSSLVAIVGAAGLAIGLALQGSLSNFAGGVLILLFKPFRVGDWISAQGLDGTVKEINIFTTKLNTFGNQLAIIPNGKLSNDNIVNYSAEDTRRDKITVGIGYGSNIKQAKDLLLEICGEDERILKDPEPQVFVGELADSSVNLSLRFWAKNEDFWAAHFHVMETLKLRFDEAGIEIPFPQRDIHMISEGE
ncbi:MULTISPECIES: mechanosensitive ion channel family protein [Robiginitalea]|uniref:Small-conductance mechanosensitive channel n=1 Tax=Robiginitalea biformata (strain ATCC BAA-864 / DSM 15991 / KCTC 12146 / HTCC2501) TaxID=313596 RepID=A4CG70_ROBBH|nr:MULTISPECIES: mechanosensitive ion channel domain-containing protein [Robiginitalea]EAR15928.1 Small-conductance mechanosensitive channel [Robiginitalea biformata HTCC2501]MDC6354461.1 mechanosensitive ion channel [Robiginitalea sp. PM2]MDC6374857.1 mechanosensitive ion channel [Robiginitalea sp. SP8]